ncbi:hypothetical protein MAC_00130 [Metarhizium acridum CQMa 102]|uniref:Inheritance of peroxisomes protein 1 n=1 Tax=Metarhizium acridum (strain CQMa 102) TaxID=655827 RepID=E9DQW1_METAQ|nr:uncharacterized protein MAC_00130 [Metarhizium acridum CQMa 102]EFY93639.1 hypothetical protein MAC_00130 [Metarhizium acridum CQMa 102]
MTIEPIEALRTDSLSPKPDMRPRPTATMRRVLTEPAIVQRERVATSAPRTVVETLYSHPDARIVSFTASVHCQSDTAGDSARAPEDGDAGNLAWWSPLERTIAVGAFCVYRAPGSVAFLSCGSALQPILPKSQCWRVDQQNSKFILQIRRPYYWRIELPVSNIEQMDKARQFKDALEKVLLFEKTICPFRRAFTVELPKRPEVRLKPWRPARSQKAYCDNCELLKNGLNSEAAALSPILPVFEHHYDSTIPSCEQPTTQVSDTTISLVTPMNEQAKKTCTTSFKSCESLTEASWCEPSTSAEKNTVMASVSNAAVRLHEYRPQYSSPHLLFDDSHLDSHQPQGQRDSDTRHRLQWDVATSSLPTGVEPTDVARSDGCEVFLEKHEELGSQDNLQRPKLRYFLGCRGGHPLTQNSVAPHLPLQDNEATETISSEESLESFYTAPSSLDSDVLLVNIAAEKLPRRPQAQFRSIEVASNSSSDAKDQTDLDGIKIERSTSTSMLDMQANGIRRRSPKKKFNPSNPLVELQSNRELFNPVRGRLGTLGNLPRAIVSKTYNLLIGPPSHLVALMLRVAARICAGEWKGDDVGFTANGHAIPVRWDYSNSKLSNEDFLNDYMADYHSWRAGQPKKVS